MQWTKEEDAALARMVESYGPQKWESIASHVPSRSGKQCRERWYNHLDPALSKGDWTEAEDTRLRELQGTHGPKWKKISTHLPGRSDNDVKNRVRHLDNTKRKASRAESKAAGNKAGAVASASAAEIAKESTSALAVEGAPEEGATGGTPGVGLGQQQDTSLLSRPHDPKANVAKPGRASKARQGSVGRRKKKAEDVVAKAEPVGPSGVAEANVGATVAGVQGVANDPAHPNVGAQEAFAAKLEQSGQDVVGLLGLEGGGQLGKAFEAVGGGSAKLECGAVGNGGGPDPGLDVVAELQGIQNMQFTQNAGEGQTAPHPAAAQVFPAAQAMHGKQHAQGVAAWGRELQQQQSHAHGGAHPLRSSVADVQGLQQAMTQSVDGGVGPAGLGSTMSAEGLQLMMSGQEDLQKVTSLRMVQEQMKRQGAGATGELAAGSQGRIDASQPPGIGGFSGNSMLVRDQGAHVQVPKPPFHRGADVHEHKGVLDNQGQQKCFTPSNQAAAGTHGHQEPQGARCGASGLSGGGNLLPHEAETTLQHGMMRSASPHGTSLDAQQRKLRQGQPEEPSSSPQPLQQPVDLQQHSLQGGESQSSRTASLLRYQNDKLGADQGWQLLDARQQQQLSLQQQVAQERQQHGQQHQSPHELQHQPQESIRLQPQVQRMQQAQHQNQLLQFQRLQQQKQQRLQLQRQQQQQERQRQQQQHQQQQQQQHQQQHQQQQHQQQKQQQHLLQQQQPQQPQQQQQHQEQQHRQQHLQLHQHIQLQLQQQQQQQQQLEQRRLLDEQQRMQQRQLQEQQLQQRQQLQQQQQLHQQQLQRHQQHSQHVQHVDHHAPLRQTQTLAHQVHEQSLEPPDTVSRGQREIVSKAVHAFSPSEASRDGTKLSQGQHDLGARAEELTRDEVAGKGPGSEGHQVVASGSEHQGFLQTPTSHHAQQLLSKQQYFSRGQLASTRGHAGPSEYEQNGESLVNETFGLEDLSKAQVVQGVVQACLGQSGQGVETLQSQKRIPEDVNPSQSEAHQFSPSPQQHLRVQASHRNQEYHHQQQPAVHPTHGQCLPAHPQSQTVQRLSSQQLHTSQPVQGGLNVFSRQMTHVATAQNGQNTNSVNSNMSPGTSSSFATAVTVMATPSVGNSNCSGGTMVTVSHPADDTTSQVSSVVSPLSAKAGKKKKGLSARRPRGSPSLSPPKSPPSKSAAKRNVSALPGSRARSSAAVASGAGTVNGKPGAPAVSVQVPLVYSGRRGSNVGVTAGHGGVVGIGHQHVAHGQSASKAHASPVNPAPVGSVSGLALACGTVTALGVQRPPLSATPSAPDGGTLTAPSVPWASVPRQGDNFTSGRGQPHVSELQGASTVPEALLDGERNRNMQSRDGRPVGVGTTLDVRESSRVPHLTGRGESSPNCVGMAAHEILAPKNGPTIDAAVGALVVGGPPETPMSSLKIQDHNLERPPIGPSPSGGASQIPQSTIAGMCSSALPQQSGVPLSMSGQRRHGLDAPDQLAKADIIDAIFGASMVGSSPGETNIEVGEVAGKPSEPVAISLADRGHNGPSSGVAVHDGGDGSAGDQLPSSASQELKPLKPRRRRANVKTAKAKRPPRQSKAASTGSGVQGAEGLACDASAVNRQQGRVGFHEAGGNTGGIALHIPVDAFGVSRSGSLQNLSEFNEGVGSGEVARKQNGERSVNLQTTPYHELSQSFRINQAADASQRPSSNGCAGIASTSFQQGGTSGSASVHQEARNYGGASQGPEVVGNVARSDIGEDAESGVIERGPTKATSRRPRVQRSQVGVSNTETLGARQSASARNTPEQMLGVGASAFPSAVVSDGVEGHSEGAGRPGAGLRHAESAATGIFSSLAVMNSGEKLGVRQSAASRSAPDSLDAASRKRNRPSPQTKKANEIDEREADIDSGRIGEHCGEVVLGPQAYLGQSPDSLDAVVSSQPNHGPAKSAARLPRGPRPGKSRSTSLGAVDSSRRKRSKHEPLPRPVVGVPGAPGTYFPCIETGEVHQGLPGSSALNVSRDGKHESSDQALCPVDQCHDGSVEPSRSTVAPGSGTGKAAPLETGKIQASAVENTSVRASRARPRDKSRASARAQAQALRARGGQEAEPISRGAKNIHCGTGTSHADAGERVENSALELDVAALSKPGARFTVANASVAGAKILGGRFSGEGSVSAPTLAEVGSSVKERDLAECHVDGQMNPGGHPQTQDRGFSHSHVQAQFQTHSGLQSRTPAQARGLVNGPAQSGALKQAQAQRRGRGHSQSLAEAQAAKNAEARGVTRAHVPAHFQASEEGQAQVQLLQTREEGQEHLDGQQEAQRQAISQLHTELCPQPVVQARPLNQSQARLQARAHALADAQSTTQRPGPGQKQVWSQTQKQAQARSQLQTGTQTQAQSRERARERARARARARTGAHSHPGAIAQVEAHTQPGPQAQVAAQPQALAHSQVGVQPQAAAQSQAGVLGAQPRSLAETREAPIVGVDARGQVNDESRSAGQALPRGEAVGIEQCHPQAEKLSRRVVGQGGKRGMPKVQSRVQRKVRKGATALPLSEKKAVALLQSQVPSPKQVQHLSQTQPHVQISTPAQTQTRVQADEQHQEQESSEFGAQPKTQTKEQARAAGLVGLAQAQSTGVAQKQASSRQRKRRQPKVRQLPTDNLGASGPTSSQVVDGDAKAEKSEKGRGRGRRAKAKQAQDCEIGKQAAALAVKSGEASVPQPPTADVVTGGCDVFNEPEANRSASVLQEATGLDSRVDMDSQILDALGEKSVPFSNYGPYAGAEEDGSALMPMNYEAPRQSTWRGVEISGGTMFTAEGGSDGHCIRTDDVGMMDDRLGGEVDVMDIGMELDVEPFQQSGPL